LAGLEEISQAVVDGWSEKTVELTRAALKQEIPPLDILREGLIPGLKKVGDLFEKGDLFLFDMVRSADAVTSSLKVLEPILQSRGERMEAISRFCIGTVHGDIHTIGKDIVATMLRVAGFEVMDLGADVPTQKFLNAVKESNSDLLGMSALLASTIPVQKEVIEKLTEQELRGRVKVMVGGAPVTEKWAESIGADARGANAIDAVRKAKQLIARCPQVY